MFFRIGDLVTAQTRRAGVWRILEMWPVMPGDPFFHCPLCGLIHGQTVTIYRVDTMALDTHTAQLCQIAHVQDRSPGMV